jgi:hypothetical protein
MSSVSAFSMTLPARGPFRDLAPDLAGKYAELAGGSAADGRALAAALDDALAKITSAAGPDATVELAFRPANGGVDIALRCGDRSSALTHALVAGKQ